MFDFLRFIETIELIEKDDEYINKSLDLIKDDFHIGKFEIVADNVFNSYSITIDKNYKRKNYFEYSKGDFKYIFYRNSDNYEYTDYDISTINSILRIVSMTHLKYILMKKANDAEYISANTRLPNTHGFIRDTSNVLTINNPINYNVYFINIKGFGLINKLFGQREGDEAIKSYADRLRQFIDKDEVLGHLGGDNFVALIKKNKHLDFIDLVTMCPIEIVKNNNKTKVNLIGVVGYYELSENNGASRDFLSKSSMACQYARSTKKIVVKHTEELEEIVNSVKVIERTFKDELEKGNFIVYYQPKFDIKTGKIIGVEALSRWVNNGKVVPPGMFVPILEKNGEIIDLDLFVLENLCKDIHNYRNMGHNIVPASCNLSRRDFENDDLEKIVINIIRKYNVRTEDIVIEVTETTNIEEKERLARFINTMNENGILTSIDDFGTGYSSLSVLRDFKVSEIKIDRSFINRELLSDSDEIIIGSIIDMAKRLSINVICEGVETKSQAEFLIRLGCNNAQGFLYSKPIPKLEFEEMLQKIGTVYD